jgi:hypothetical protein
MDRLYADVAALVEQADATGEDPLATWEGIRALSYTAAGRAVDGCEAPAQRPQPPRLTESWFCCAEPTRGQMSLDRFYQRSALPVRHQDP